MWETKVNNDFGGSLLCGGPNAMQSWEEYAGNAWGKCFRKETDVGLAGKDCASLHMQLLVDDVGQLSKQ